MIPIYWFNMSELKHISQKDKYIQTCFLDKDFVLIYCKTSYGNSTDYHYYLVFPSTNVLRVNAFELGIGSIHIEDIIKESKSEEEIIGKFTEMSL